MNIISVRIPRAYFIDGRVSTDSLEQVIHQGLWSQCGVMPAPVKVTLHEGHMTLASGCTADDVDRILGLGDKTCTQTN
ncbi:hypothetical protein J8629_15330 [Serratia fonticola]|uniref:hypothetical protein n=1 Tax=Serratia fonticola TaxID=47917 RepID=UPI001AE76202|nr:hypothetical protein [Serratia fonticola]MBP0998423.1 hypothetical protein [Serratia fonticola]